MKNTTLHIKNMVCPRCIASVKQMLENLEIPFSKITLGEVVIQKSLSPSELSKITIELRNLGFDLIIDKKKKLIEQIKTTIIDYIHYSKKQNIKVNFSEYISTKIGFDYSYLSNIFSEIENTTIEKYIILQKIERIKELISYNELNFSEIAFELDYSSVAHLSRQFKHITSLTPTQYKALEKKTRNNLSDI